MTAALIVYLSNALFRVFDNLDLTQSAAPGTCVRYTLHSKPRAHAIASSSDVEYRTFGFVDEPCLRLLQADATSSATGNFPKSIQASGY
jgi:hypothetical protein